MRASEQLSFLQSEREYRITHTLLFHVILCGVALVHYLYNKRRYVCLSVSMFRVAGQTAGPIETKLDTRTHVHPGSVSVKVNVKVIHVCVRE